MGGPACENDFFPVGCAYELTNLFPCRLVCLGCVGRKFMYRTVEV